MGIEYLFLVREKKEQKRYPFWKQRQRTLEKEFDEEKDNNKF